MKFPVFIVFLFFLSTYYLNAAPGAEIRFIENKKQWSSAEFFRADIPNGKVIFKENSVHYYLYDVNQFRHRHHSCEGCASTDTLQHSAIEKVKMHHIKMSFVNGRGVLKGNGELDNRINYLLGKDSSKWSANVRSFGEIIYQDLYPGIDVRFYSDRNQLKYDLVVHPGANLEQFEMEYEGATKLELQANQLRIGTSLEEIVEKIPYSYQLHQQDTIDVKARYIRKGNKIKFRLAGDYDPEKPLIIDPLLIFSTYSGSVSDNWGNTATFDEAGNLYSGGITDGPFFPATPGAFETDWSGSWDVAILKYDSTGSNLLYATYLGGSFAETPQSLVVNNKNELLILGATSSPDFPILNGFDSSFKGGQAVQPLPGVNYDNGSDLFVARLSEDGSKLLSSTYMGGTENDGINLNFDPLVKNYGDQYRGDIFVDAADQVYVASNSASPDFPLKDPFQPSFAGGNRDGVVFSMSPDLGTLRWSSFLGGNDSDAAYSIKVNPAGNVFVAGGTASFDFPTTADALIRDQPGGVDGFAVRIDQQAGTLINSTYLGTSSYDQVYFVDLDQNGFVYVLGQTAGDYPEKAADPNRPDLIFDIGGGHFIHKLSTDLTTTIFSTNFGNPDPDPDISLTAFLVNNCGYIYLSGWGGSINGPQIGGILTGYVGGDTNDMPLSSDAFQNTTDGSDFYLMVLRQDASSLLYATYFGGSGSPGEHVDGGTSRFDKDGIVYQAVCADCGTNSNNTFPTTEGSWSRANLSPNCNNAAFKFDLASLNAAFTTNSVAGDQPGLSSGCFPLEVVFRNTSIGGNSFFWDFGNGVKSQDPDQVTVVFDKPGFYNVSLVAIDLNTCKQVDIATGIIRVYEQNFTISDDLSLCFGESGQLNAAGGDTYQWIPVTGLSDHSIPNPVVTPEQTTVYKLVAINENGCIFTDSVTVLVNPKINPGFTYQKVYNCDQFPTFIFENTTENATTFQWEFGDGVFSTETDPVHQFNPEQNSSTYNVKLKAADGQCEEEVSIPVSVSRLFIPNVFTPNPGDDINATFTINSDAAIRLEVFNRWGVKVFESENYQDEWDGSGLTSGIYYYKVTIAENGQACFGWVDILK